jgi:hypothetical protein
LVLKPRLTLFRTGRLEIKLSGRLFKPGLLLKFSKVSDVRPAKSVGGRPSDVRPSFR